MKRISFVLILAYSCHLFAASHDDAYQKNAPFFYALLASAASARNDRSASRHIEQWSEKKCNILANAEFKHDTTKETCFIKLLLVEDAHKKRHAVISSSAQYNDRTFSFSNDLKFWLSTYINEWRQRYGKVTTLVGYDEGGACAFSMSHHYEHARAIIFMNNHHFTTTRSSQDIQFWLTNRHLKTTSGAKTKSIEIPSSRKRPREYAQFGKSEMRDFLGALEGKKWSDVL